MFFVVTGKNIMRFLYGIALVLLFVFIFGTKGQNYEIIQTSNSNIKKTVILDAGHGLPDRWCHKFKWN